MNSANGIILTALGVAPNTFASCVITFLYTTFLSELAEAIEMNQFSYFKESFA